MRFTWDLTKLSAVKSEIESHYHIRVATPEDEKSVRSVISSAFSLDMNWSDTLKSLRDHFEAQIDKVFAEKEVPCVVVLHGARIIGASSLDLSKEAESHLLSGPCILSEYRNRGLGTTLLHRSLQMLRDAGLEKAHGITKANVPAAKFIYPKFNSTSAEYNFEPELVGL
jgi:N-acetylglutamate synthase-like GNAT family acetyltransferase